jgi:hypothetical protein
VLSIHWSDFDAQFKAGIAVIMVLSIARRRNRSPLIYEEQSDTQLQRLELN